MIYSQPRLATLIRRVRGGYLKIQGTWMPYEASHRSLTQKNHFINLLIQVALRLSRRSVFLSSSFPFHLMYTSQSCVVDSRGLDTIIRVSHPNLPKYSFPTDSYSRRPTFPSTCLSPDQPGYGQVVANGSTR